MNVSPSHRFVDAKTPLRTRFLVRTLLVLSLAVALGACSEKAKSLQVGAEQFEAEAVAAVDLLGIAVREQYETLPLTEDQARASFLIAALNPNERIDLAWLDTAAELQLGSGTSQIPPAWRALLSTQRQLYREFAEIFDRLPEGSILAAPDVEAAVPILDELVARLAAMGAYVEAYPVVFIGQRTSIADSIESIRSDATLAPAEKRERLAPAYAELLQVVQAERQLQRQILQRVAAALIVGQALREQLKLYDQVTLGDILEAVREAFDAAGSLTGQSFEQVEGTAIGLIENVKADRDLSALFATVQAGLQP